jgi:antagonist of KipI
MASGVPPGGAADLTAFRLTNLILGNHKGVPALEMALVGGVFEMLVDCFIALTGGDMAPCIDGRPIEIGSAVRVRAGQRLELGVAATGCFAYLGVAGGFEASESLGSFSTYVEGGIGGFSGRALQAGDVLRGLEPKSTPEVGAPAAEEHAELCSPPSVLRFTRGPQIEYFNARSYRQFTVTAYRVSPRSNRMGYRLEGPVPDIEPVERTRDTGSGPTDVIEEGNAVGSIQIAGGTEVICLGRDCGTSGAYAKIGCIIGADVSRMAQLAPGSEFRFEEVDRAGALEALDRQAEALDRVRHRSGELTRLSAGLAA